MMKQELERSVVHPEDAALVVPEEAAGLEKRLWSVLPLCVLSGMLGMVYGAAALSTALLYGSILEVVSLLPLVAALVALAAGWTAAMFCMCKESVEHAST